MVIRQAINLCVYNAGIYIRIVKPVHWLPKHQYNVLIITIGAVLSALFTCVSHLYKNTFFSNLFITISCTVTSFFI